ncbi:MAG TPA: TadE family protein [Kiloniellaceae bacterium]|nr:TadE family protein [Kiloniellaceae bacterium]
MRRFLQRPRQFLGSLRRSRDGASFVEFSLVAPFLVLLTLGIVDFGRVMWTSTTIEHVAREAARYAALHGAGAKVEATAASTQTYATDRATGLKASDMQVGVTYLGGSNASGSSVTVSVTYDFNLMLAAILGFDPIQLDSESTFIIL